ncbi:MULTISPECIES: hypothetical protein [Streptococcus]|uniref:hypothetical protein n=1 Tax=Streptococcus TaxID=1301 RepID=UPI000373C9B4|nr:hypothetical protein [Streptococcus thoraltensis]
MLVPTNEYYTEEEHAHALKMMRRSMETKRAITQAKAVVTKKNNNIETYKQLIQEKATQTKTAVTNIKGQLDTAIKGATSDKINESVDTLVTGYDEIV